QRTIDLPVGQIAEPPLDVEPARRLAIRSDRAHRITCDEQPRVAGAPDRLDRVGETLVRPDHADAEDRAAVVAALGVARKDGMRNHTGGDAERGEQLTPALAVHDDAVETSEETSPEVLLVRRAARQEVMRREDRRNVGAEEPSVEL